MENDNDNLMEEVNSIVATRTAATSAFVDDILKLVPSKAGAEDREQAEKLGYALEELMTRQMRDCRMIIDICVAIAKITGLPSTKVVQTVQRASKKLNVPSPSWLAKNIRAANLIERYPALGKVKDVEKLVSLQRLPEDELIEISETGQLLIPGDDPLDVFASTRKELTSAIRMKVAPPSLDDYASKQEAHKRSMVDGDGEVIDAESKSLPIKPMAVKDGESESTDDEFIRAGASKKLDETLAELGYDAGVQDLASRIGKVRAEIDQLREHGALTQIPDPNSLTKDLDDAAVALSEALKRFKMSWESSEAAAPEGPSPEAH